MSSWRQVLGFLPGLPSRCPNHFNNNGGKNYRLVPYQGRGGTAIATSEAIFVLSDISSYKLYRLIA